MIINIIINTIIIIINIITVVFLMILFLYPIISDQSIVRLLLDNCVVLLNDQKFPEVIDIANYIIQKERRLK